MRNVLRVFKKGEAGGAAVEYVIVSIFGLVLAMAGVAIVTKTVKTKLTQFEEKMGIPIEDEALDTWLE